MDLFAFDYTTLHYYAHHCTTLPHTFDYIASIIASLEIQNLLRMGKPNCLPTVRNGHRFEVESRPRGLFFVDDFKPERHQYNKDF